LAALVEAQVTPAQPATPTIVSNVDEVSLDVVVRAKKKPVLDLKPEDLAITDDGTPVKISALRLVTGDTGSQRLLTLVFDRIDSSAAANARNLANKVMKEIPAQGFAFSVLGMHGRLKLYQGFNPDRRKVTEAIRAATEAEISPQGAAAEDAEKELMTVALRGTNPAGARVSADERAEAQVMANALADSQRIIQEQHTSASLAALLALTRAERGIPGRKAIIYFSSGSRFDQNSEEMLGSIVGAANRSGVSVYTIDVSLFNEQVAQELLTTMALGNSVGMNASRASAPQAPTTAPAGAALGSRPMGDLTTPGMMSMVSNQIARFEIRENKGDSGPLSQLADNTDGGYVPAGGNPRKMAQAMLQDLTTYYEVSYVPPIKEYDGRFRSVSIKPVRTGLKVHSRSGYFALPPDNGAGRKLFEAPLLKVFAEAQLPSDIKCRTRVLQLGDLGNGYGSALIVEVPVSELATREDPNTNLYSLHASIVAQIKNSAEEVIEHFSEDLPRHGALDAKDATQFATISMQRHFTADPGDYTLEAAVLDRIGGKTGATRSMFTIAGTAAGSSLSDLALVQRMDPFPDGVDPNEPMQYGDRKVVATVADRMPRGVRRIDLFSVVYADTQSGQQPRLELSVLRNQEPIAQVPLPLRTVTGVAAVPYVASIQSGSLPPGDYLLIETLTQGERTSEKSLGFRIEGPELASAGTPAGDHVAASNEDLGILETSKLQADPAGPRRLVITSLPQGSVPPPSAEELIGTVEAARKHALGYAKSLPNFVCIETTSRSVDPSGSGNWRHRDTIAELLRYADNVETRTMLERNGERTSLDRNDLDPAWTISKGEFGTLLKLVFDRESKADFEWKEAATLGSTTVHVLAYRVSSKNETMVLNDNTRNVGVGFHGLVYVDTSTGGVRRITLEADDVPRDFSIHAASMTVDYDYVAIGTHDYLMPQRAAVMLRRGRKQIDLNEIAFRGYRRYASQTKIIATP
jgi:VWFA-related protein